MREARSPHSLLLSSGKDTGEWFSYLFIFAKTWMGRGGGRQRLVESLRKLSQSFETALRYRMDSPT